MEESGPGGRLDLLKALGDNTRYAIYLELARSPKPLSTAEVASTLGLHLNTVRPHLERMREVGLLQSRPDASGGVGRPQKLYELATDAPSLGLEPPVYPLLAQMLLQIVVAGSTDPDTVLEAGRDAGRAMAYRRTKEPDCREDTVAMLEELGFDPAYVAEGGRTSVAFGHCPFGELAQAQPQVVCALHRGMMEGFADERGGGMVESFCDISARTPCRAEVVEA
ncbi:MAG: helix-turn-helix domain-containing protein [Microthrixaceae bacterium]|nr:helix-turn-helix domain-containing protein [Microthrixaceae bacterium]